MVGITRTQRDVLVVVANNSPVTAKEIERHWPIASSSIRSALDRLELRGYVERDYTSRFPLISWSITMRGNERIAEEDE